MKPTAVTCNEDAASGDLSLQFADGGGQNLAIQLTPELQAAVLAALLARPPGQLGAQRSFHSRTLKTIGVQAFRLASGHPGLQFLVGPSQAIDVAFPHESIPVIQKCLAQLASGSPLDAAAVKH